MYNSEFIKYQENRFDSFCRTVIQNSSLDNLRTRKRHEERYLPLEEVKQDVWDLKKTEDTYSIYSRTYKVKGITIKVTDERIGEAVQFIMPNQRAVLLLSFFKEYSDMDIARLLGISHKTVAYRKKMAMRKLRLLLEGMDHA